MGPLGHEVIGPDVVAVGRTQTHTGAVVESQTASLGLPLGNLQPLLAPDAHHPRVIDPPAIPPKRMLTLRYP